MLIVVDTNCVVSQAISPTGAPAEILRRWRAEELDLAVSEAILAEPAATPAIVEDDPDDDKFL